MDNALLPSGLQSLMFGGGFNQNIDNLVFPSSLRQLSLGAALLTIDMVYSGSWDGGGWIAGKQRLVGLGWRVGCGHSCVKL